jgi:hypothetical protein
MRRIGFFLWVWLAFAPLTNAHIGSLNVVYESTAPPVPVRVIIRPPGVVPGLATIDVRVLTNDVKRVTALPVHWRAGVNGAPPPDVAKPVEGEPNLYHAELWLMALGAYSVHVEVETAHGTSKFIVPVNSLATQRLPMSGTLAGILIALGVLLFTLAVTVVTAGVRESVLDPGASPSNTRRWLGCGAGVGAAILLALAIAGGRAWWNAEDGDYRNNKMYQPVECDVKVRTEGSQRIALLNILTNDARATWPGLVPDHGKLMHIFMVREPDLDVLAHLHPIRRSHRTFEAALPSVPPGNYRLYADVTHESGLSQTLTAKTTVPEFPPAGTAEPKISPDPDDSWFTGPALGKTSKPFEFDLGDGRVMRWDAKEPASVGRETTLRFTIHEPDGSLAKLDAYMGMLGHMAIRRDDGAVFTHLHPAGNLSVAAQQVFQIRAGDKPPRRITPEMMEQLCQPPSADLPQQPLAFPYEFPKPGRYRLWVQVKIKGVVHTAVFDTEIKAAGNLVSN